MTDIDDVTALERLDSEGVLGAVEGFAEQCRAAWDIGRAATGLPAPEGIESIVVLGMGGSGVSGDVTQAIVEPRLAAHFRTVKTYGPLPHWVGRNTLVFGCSYSGSTEETLAATADAYERGARVVSISSGGPLQEAAERRGHAHVTIPTGLQPRASLGYLTLPILAVLQTMQLIPPLDDDVSEAVGVLSELQGRCHRSRARPENPAKDLAARLHERIPVIYGGAGLGSVAAYRFKCDLNEYGKAPAFANEFPELNHNEIVGWDRLDELTRKNFVLVLLRDSQEHERVKLRFDITGDLIGDSFSEIIEIQSEGTSPLARLLSLILVTQLAAIYVGLAYGVDPGPVQVIQKLKSELAAR
ncbi:MAG TPA: bifunctional phosphoglucose/phosphomannose isomerase [Actinomycetota bacterium]|nr:bifunctional phosphoglucose/phosphomannose isomerase [Actinomycetota bacterium]